jgi:hypothetical protein
MRRLLIRHPRKVVAAYLVVMTTLIAVLQILESTGKVP